MTSPTVTNTAPADTPAGPGGIDIEPRRAIALVAGATLVGTLAVTVALGPEFGIGAALIIGWAGAALVVPRSTIVALVAYAAIAGWLRRYVDHVLFAGDAEWASELLLIPIPVVGVVLGLLAIWRGGLVRPTPLTYAVTACVLLAGVAVFNPAQGPLMVGLGGLVYLGAPFLWFYAGRVFIDAELLRRLFLIVVIVAVPAAVYGLIGGAGHYTTWDWAYYDTTDFAILFGAGIDLAPRPIGFATSPEEFGRSLAFAIVATICLIGPRVRSTAGWAGVGAVIGLATAAIITSGTRISIVFLSLGVAVVAAVWRQWSIRSIIVASVVGLVSIVGVAQILAQLPETGVWYIDRQVDGLSRPWDSDQSTLSNHLGTQARAMEWSVRRPLGWGTGLVTPSADRFGDNMYVTEGDLPNAAVAWGLAGVAAYGAVLLFGASSALQVGYRRGDGVALAGVGLLVVMAMRWSYGGIYSLVPLVWLTLGWFDTEAQAPGDRPTPDEVQANPHV